MSSFPFRHQAARAGLLALAMLSTTGLASAASPWTKPAAAPDDLLPGDQAFQLVAAQRTGDSIFVSWAIAPGYYLYRKRLGFEVLVPAGTPKPDAVLPVGLRVPDETDGTTEVYREVLRARLRTKVATAAVRRLRIRYQGCADAGVCYPPVVAEVDVTDAPR